MARQVRGLSKCAHKPLLGQEVLAVECQRWCAAHGVERYAIGKIHIHEAWGRDGQIFHPSERDPAAPLQGLVGRGHGGHDEGLEAVRDACQGGRRRPPGHARPALRGGVEGEPAAGGGVVLQAAALAGGEVGGDVVPQGDALALAWNDTLYTRLFLL